MSEAEILRSELEERFALAPEAVKVQREKRVWIQADQKTTEHIFEYLVKLQGFRILCTITGLDEGENLGFIYHLARDGGMMANLKTACPKGAAIRTVTGFFPGAAIYERELEDLLGARVEGLPPGQRYPLPEDWPTGDHPLLKDWKPRTTAPEAGVQGAPAAPPAGAEKGSSDERR